jgi:hypothetical protein
MEKISIGLYRDLRSAALSADLEAPIERHRCQYLRPITKRVMAVLVTAIHTVASLFFDSD